MKHTTRCACAAFFLGLLVVQGIAQLDGGLVAPSDAQPGTSPDITVQAASPDVTVQSATDPISPLGIPDAFGSSVSSVSATSADGPSFLALAKYAWSGDLPRGTIIPASASAAASSGKTYEASVNRALDVLVLLFPQEAANINNNRQQLVESIVSGKKSAPQSLSMVQHAVVPTTVTGNEITAASVLSPCLEATISVIVNFVSVVLSTVSFAGPPPAWAKVSNSLKGLLRTMGQNWLAGFRLLIANVRNATTVGSRLVAVGKLVSQIFSQGGKIILQAFKDNLSWWDWIRFGVTIVLAIGAFALSGGAWLTVKLVNIVYANASLIASIVTAVTACV